MNLRTENHVTTKLFIGCVLTSEVKMHLNQSPAWKQASIAPPKDSEELTTVHYHEKDYIGLYLPTCKSTVKELKSFENIILAKLQGYCPSLEVSAQKICVFPQLFIT